MTAAAPTRKPRVLIEACADYDVDRITHILGGGLDTLGLRPFGNTLVKPNCVASGEYFPHAHTRAEFLEGMFRALNERSDSSVTEMALGERCGITVPTRYAFKHADYYPMLDRVGAQAWHFDEVPQVEVPMYHPGRLRDSMFFPEPITKADFFVNCPKFKAHPWTTVTFSMKNYIGIQDDRHRLIDHDHMLNEKVADLQYALQPQFIAIDAIIAGEGRMLTPIPFDLGLIVMGDNQVAFDAVCCHIIGVDPLSVPHIRLAWERGFGPVELESIDIGGSVSLQTAQAKAAGFRVGLIRVEDYFEGTSIRAYAGKPPGDDVDYCWGGCPGALQEAIEILRLFDQRTDEKMPPVHIVFGDYEGEIPAKAGESVVFVGDCAAWQGQLDGRGEVTIDNIYVDRSQKDPHKAASEDIYAKMAKVTWRTRNLDKDGVIRLAGCPVSVAEHVLTLVKIGKLKNPYLAPENVVNFTSAYLSWRSRVALKRALREPYQRPGPTKRGSARPSQNLPPEGASRRLEIVD